MIIHSRKIAAQAGRIEDAGVLTVICAIFAAC
jgi:hypothetical protein